MSGERRRRGDFVRATMSVLRDTELAEALSREVAHQLCDIAAAACGAARAALFVLERDERPETVVVCLAQSSAPSGNDALLVERVSADLLERALAQGGLIARGDLLIGALDALDRLGEVSGASGGSFRFIVLQSAGAQRDGKRRGAAFTEVDRRRLEVLTTLVSLKQTATRAGASEAMLTGLNRTLAAEPSVDGKLAHLAGCLAQATSSDHALIWSRATAQSAEMRLHATYGVPDQQSTGVYARSAANPSAQQGLAELARLEHPSAVATSALPWLTEILDRRGEDLDAQAVVTPIRRQAEVVGIAICTAQAGARRGRASAAALEKRALLTALSDQIALTTEYVRTALNAQQSARRFALLAALGEISLAKMGMDELLDAILARVQDYFESASVSVHLLDGDRSSVRTRSLHSKITLAPAQRCDLRVPVRSQGQMLGTLHLRRDSSRPFDDADQETLEQVAEQIGLALATSGRYQIQASLAILDALTGLPNRRSADEALEREFARATRHGGVFSVALLDVDHFKQINDLHGHDRGDAVLHEIGRMFKAHLRATDYMARFGGEEFLIILTGSDEAGARSVCERLRHAVSLINVRDEQGRVIPLTASLGGASFPRDGRTRAEILRGADAALYQAKAAGRNTSRWAGDDAA